MFTQEHFSDVKRAMKTMNYLIDHADETTISSVGNDGYPTIKTMRPARCHDCIQTFYFATTRNALRTLNYLNNPKAAIHFYDANFVRTLMLQGTMRVLGHEESIQYYESQDDEYFKLGINDPSFCILEFRAERGRFYSNLHIYEFIVHEFLQTYYDLMT